MQVEDDVESRIFCPTANTLEIGKTALGEVFAVGIHDGLVNPISKWNTDGIESKASDLGDIVLGNPAAPMFLEGGVGPSLSEFQYSQTRSFGPRNPFGSIHCSSSMVRR